MNSNGHEADHNICWFGGKTDVSSNMTYKTSKSHHELFINAIISWLPAVEPSAVSM